MSHKITVLDGYTLNPGDLSWESLEQLGECTIHDRIDPKKTVEFCKHADIVLTNKAPITKADLEQLPNLKYIGILATGYNIVDIQAASNMGIPVCNVPGYSGSSVAQATMALLLECTNHTGIHAQSVKEGGWSRCKDFSYTLQTLVELEGLTFGTIGFGDIGKKVVALAQAFGMRTIVATRTIPSPTPKDIDFVSLDELFSESDVVSLNCPLTEKTEGLINKDRLNQMKQSAILINTSRGPLVVESDLAEALNEGKIAAAGLDVLCQEPPRKGSPLLKAKNCYITPHTAWATTAARKRLLEITIENIKAFSSGKVQNKVN